MRVEQGEGKDFFILDGFKRGAEMEREGAAERDLQAKKEKKEHPLISGEPEENPYHI